MSEPDASPAPAARQRNRSRTRPAVAAPTFLRRQIPTYTFLQPDGLDRLHAQAEQILAEIGVEFRGDDEALSLWRKAGAKVEGVRVRFEPGHVTEIIKKTTPRTFIQHGRDGQHGVEIGGDAIVFAPAYGSPFVYDREKGRRYGSLEDFKNFVKMTWMSPWLHHSGGTICEPVDVPVNKRHLDMVYAHIKHSAKPFMGSVTAPERAEDSIDMCRILFGADFVDKNCVILGNINTNSPLIFDGVMSMALRAYARANQAAVVVPFILGGAMGPVTTAGAIAQAHAEAMVGVALTQLERQFPQFHVAALRRTHLRHAGTGHGLSRHRAVGAASGRALALRRIADGLEGRGLPGSPGKRRFTLAGLARRRQFHPACRRLAGRWPRHGLREIRARLRSPGHDAQADGRSYLRRQHTGNGRFPRGRAR
jgi:trimethylamine--corrinoid protein Co-methyltransferase